MSDFGTYGLRYPLGILQYILPWIREPRGTVVLYPQAYSVPTWCGHLSTPAPTGPTGEVRPLSSLARRALEKPGVPPAPAHSKVSAKTCACTNASELHYFSLEKRTPAIVPVSMLTRIPTPCVKSSRCVACTAVRAFTHCT